MSIHTFCDIIAFSAAIALLFMSFLMWFGVSLTAVGLPLTLVLIGPISVALAMGFANN